MDQSALFTAMDRSMTEVAKTEFEQLSQGLSQEEVAARVRGAIVELQKLPRGVPPDYRDPWVALFYLTWYQPGHIILARRLIAYLSEARGSNQLTGHDNFSVAVIDFGCGTLAMQFAVAWAAAQALEDGAKVKSIRIDSYDASGPMIRLGIKLWEQFKLDIQNCPSLSKLSRVSENLVQPQYWGTDPTLSEEFPWPAQELWMSAMHTVYAKTLDSAKESLSQIETRFQPDVGLLTCHGDSASICRVRQASPFNPDTYGCRDVFTNSRASLPFQQVSSWRQGIGRKWSVDHRYLRKPVTSRCDASGLIYVRQ